MQGLASKNCTLVYGFVVLLPFQGDFVGSLGFGRDLVERDLRRQFDQDQARSVRLDLENAEVAD